MLFSRSERIDLKLANVLKCALMRNSAIEQNKTVFLVEGVADRSAKIEHLI